jgi:hypothetical protein
MEEELDALCNTTGSGEKPRINAAYRFNDRGFFRYQTIYILDVSGVMLSHRVLPIGGSVGTFAWDGSHLLRLTREQPDNLRTALAREGRPLDEADPHAMAELLAEVLLSGQNYHHHVLHSAGQLREGAYSSYGLKEAEWSRLSGTIFPPTITRKAEQGWAIECWTLYGWMHNTNSVVHCQFRVSLTYAVQPIWNVACDELFASIPQITY